MGSRMHVDRRRSHSHMLDADSLIAGENRADGDTLNVGVFGLKCVACSMIKKVIIYWRIQHYFDSG